jgi:hypothetical protein
MKITKINDWDDMKVTRIWRSKGDNNSNKSLQKINFCLFFLRERWKAFCFYYFTGLCTPVNSRKPLNGSWIRNKQKRIDFFIFVFVCVWFTSSWGYSRDQGVHTPLRSFESWMVLNQTQMKNTKKEKNFKTFFVFVSFCFCLCFIHELLRALEGSGVHEPREVLWVLNGLESNTNEKHKKRKKF